MCIEMALRPAEQYLWLQIRRNWRVGSFLLAGFLEVSYQSFQPSSLGEIVHCLGRLSKRRLTRNPAVCLHSSPTVHYTSTMPFSKELLLSLQDCTRSFPLDFLRETTRWYSDLASLFFATESRLFLSQLPFVRVLGC